ncbi:MAG: hypothetical protein RL068_957 [Actinomycetota bacterium]|jgi:hypothetical protein
MAVLAIASPAIADEPADVPAFYAKQISENKVKIYAKGIVGAGKVSFISNGRQVGWIRANSESDPKLRKTAAGFYFVRTATIAPGGQVLIEIKVDGEIAYSEAFGN